MSTTLIRIFLTTADLQRKPDQFMRKVGGLWQSIPAGDAVATVESLGLALRGLGVKPGDRVGLLCETRYEWALSDLAVLGIGAITVPIYPSSTPAQCEQLFSDSECRVVILSTDEQFRKLVAVRDRCRKLEHIVRIERGASGGTHRVREHLFEELLRDGERRRTKDPKLFRKLAEQVKPGDVATIIYTSGTTGEPKGACLTHANIVSNVDSCLELVDLQRTDVALSFLPLCHVFERMAGLYAMLRAGATIAYAESMDTVAANALEVRPTVLNGVPRFYEKVHARVMESRQALPERQRKIFDWGLAVLGRKARAHFQLRGLSLPDRIAAALADRLVARKIRERVGGRLRLCISGGAALHPDVMEFFFAIGIPVLEGYGLTETSPVICLNRPGREKPGSVGLPIPGVEMKLGAEGEILTRGPHVMKGYYKNPAATAEAIRDGWFHTGDVGEIDAEGFLRITDRLKDLIVTAGGKKVAPQPAEAMLKTSRWITEAVLVGDRRPFVVCLIVPNFAHLEAEAAARGWRPAPLRDRLESAEVQAMIQSEIDLVNRDRAPFEQI